MNECKVKLLLIVNTIITKYRLGCFFVFLMLFGCNTPEPVQIVDETNDSNLIEVKNVSTTSDTLFISSGVDTTGIPEWGTQRFYARMAFTTIRYDFSPRLDSIMLAEAIFFDSSHPIQRNGHILAYPSLDAGTLQIDSDTLKKYERSIKLPNSMTDTIIGYRYQLKKPYDYIPSGIWSASGSTLVNPFSVTFTTPPELRVTEISPRHIRINEPLHVKWRCDNPLINIIISREGMLQQRSWVPVMHLRVRNVKGEITIPAKILEILPRRFNRFLFTFSSHTRIVNPAGSSGGYPNEVLIEAVSIHNILLNVL